MILQRYIQNGRLRVLSLVVLLLLSLSNRSYADQIVIAADAWCPFNCQPDSDLPGFMVEIAQRVFSEKGHDVLYVKMAWERAIREARQGNINAVIGAFREDTPDFIFPDQELALVGNTFFTRKDSAWRYEGVDSLNGVRLGVIKGYDYGDELREHIKINDEKTVLALAGNMPLKRGIKMLDLDRLDAMIEGEQVFWYTANQLGLQGHFSIAGQSGELNKSYIAFSPNLDTSVAYAAMLSDGLISLRKSGELESILQKYGLEDWR